MLTSHHLHLARLQLSDPEQAELLRAALPLALDRALDELHPEGGSWLLLRHVPAVQLSLDPEAGLHEAVARLEVALGQALRAAVADPAEAVFAPDAVSLRAESWVDALSGRLDRAWAWQRLGLWPAEPEPQAVPRAALLSHALATLDRELPALPDPASPAQRRRLLLSKLLARGLLPRWLAVADATHWARLSLGLPGAAALAGLVAEALAGPSADSHSAAPSGAQPGPSGATAAAVLAAWPRTPLTVAARPAAALHLAWLTWLLAEPLTLQGGQSAQQLRSLAQALLADVPPAQAAARSSSKPAPALHAPSTSTAADAPASTWAQADATPSWPTAHGGALHLLSVLPLLLPGELHAERLLRLAHHGLQIPLDDAVIAVLLGRAEPPEALRAPDPDPWHTSADRMALDNWLNDRLHRHLPAERLRELPADTLGWLVRRDACLLAEPGGWCAQFLEADPLLRRCGLDRDPGHLPWLGLSVRLQYGGDQP